MSVCLFSFSFYKIKKMNNRNLPPWWHPGQIRQRPLDVQDEEDEEEQQQPLPQPPQRVPNPPIFNVHQDDPSGPIRLGNGRLATSVAWMFTIRLRNPSPENPNPPNQMNYTLPTIQQVDVDAIRRNIAFMTRPVFIRYQLEQGNNGDPLWGNAYHLQGYMEFDAPINAVQICMLFGWIRMLGWLMEDVYLAVRHGTKESALLYVWKDHTSVRNQVTGEPELRVEEGVLRPGNPIDIAVQVRNMIRDDADFEDIADAFPAYAMRYGNNIRSQITERERNAVRPWRPVQVYVHWGDTGTGKTKDVWQSFGYGNVYSKIGGKFFDGYVPKRHEVLLLDEVSDIQFEQFLKMLDGNPFIVEIKGGALQARWKTVVITSNKPPHLWYSGLANRHIEALYRRLKTGGIIKYVDSNKPEEERELDDTRFPQNYENVKLVDTRLFNI